MEQLQIFSNEEFGEIRTVVINNEPVFCLSDICKALEMSNPTMVAQRLDEDERTKLDLGRQGETNFITESGVYAVILRSDKPNAKKFRKWVTSEVLPSIRKNGGYIAGQETLSDEELLSKALMVAQRKIDEKNQLIAMQDSRIQQMVPKERFADAVASSETSILIGDLAKILRQNGIKIGQKRLFVWLRENGYLIKRKGTDWNMPTQKSMERGLLEVKERTISNPDGSVRVTKTSKVTGKGQVYFVNLFMTERENNE